MDASKYKTGYFPVGKKYCDWAKKDHIEKTPIWCSVDMRDGNQSLVVPMSPEEKIEFFKVLLKVGFKEIEVGFPAANDSEYEFLRTIIDNNMIPDDVTVQVLTQCREHIIRKTFEACEGAKNVIVHFYNSTSKVQREQVFEKSKEEILQIAVDGARLVKQLSKGYKGNFRFEYSPESFTGTEPEFALEVCNAVLDVLEPSDDNNVIINLPATVELSLPHIYASQVEYMSKNLKYRENVTLSVHTHNDRGTGVADTELAILAGAGRVEGTLFGNGERTGNVDIITLALNMYTHGVDPGLDFSDMGYLIEMYEKCTGMHVYERLPYAGALVFAAFSGGHQDAIAKGMNYRDKNHLKEWNVPYIPIDPSDIGRKYEADIIRVNSQSGKGGIGYILERNFGYVLPPKMREALSYICKATSDREHRELRPNEILSIFSKNYLNIEGKITITDYEFMHDGGNVKIYISFMQDGVETPMEAEGNGSLSAISNALKKYTGKKYILQEFTQHSMQGQGSQSVAASYIGLESTEGKMYWGAGTDTDVIKASAKALLSAFENMVMCQ
ncbi:MAG: 2-isopropylmalate synthase [Lachnospiraceae bacterium]|nr:2-isopropylmalate synthase [Lachnospiraceae bacterium]